MPRKRRRHPKRRAVPVGLAEISGAERALWSVSGPLIDPVGDGVQELCVHGTSRPLYHVWPNWPAWAEFYASVRDELYPPDRPWLRERSAAERLYQGWVAGADLALRHDLIVECAADDPRRLLEGRHAT